MSQQANRDRVLYLLKTRGPQTAQALSELLGMTSMGARGHLEGLEAEGLVCTEDLRQGRGRPKRFWHLTEKARSRFPDRHSELLVELLDGVQNLLGQAGLEQLITQREQASLARYTHVLGQESTTGGKVARLSELRSAEGYMADWQAEESGSYLLLENHCPICAAAERCQGFCRSELEQFQSLLAPARVERVEHQLAGARRCAYRITP